MVGVRHADEKLGQQQVNRLAGEVGHQEPTSLEGSVSDGINIIGKSRKNHRNDLGQVRGQRVAKGGRQEDHQRHESSSNVILGGSAGFDHLRQNFFQLSKTQTAHNLRQTLGSTKVVSSSRLVSESGKKSRDQIRERRLAQLLDKRTQSPGSSSTSARYGIDHGGLQGNSQLGQVRCNVLSRSQNGHVANNLTSLLLDCGGSVSKTTLEHVTNESEGGSVNVMHKLGLEQTVQSNLGLLRLGNGTNELGNKSLNLGVGNHVTKPVERAVSRGPHLLVRIVEHRHNLGDN